MAQRKRRIAPGKEKKRKVGRQEGRKAERQEGKKAARHEGRKVAARRRQRPTASTKDRKAAEKRAFEVFDQQIDPLWDRLTNECRQFAAGFNQEMGADQLRVESNPAGLMVRMATDGAEAFFQLDRDARHVSVAMTTGCTNFGSCITDQAPVGLAILDGQLRFLFGGSAISEEELAVKILTDLLEADSPKPSR
jgi:hypothetical protein